MEIERRIGVELWTKGLFFQHFLLFIFCSCRVWNFTTKLIFDFGYHSNLAMLFQVKPLVRSFAYTFIWNLHISSSEKHSGNLPDFVVPEKSNRWFQNSRCILWEREYIVCVLSGQPCHHQSMRHGVYGPGWTRVETLREVLDQPTSKRFTAVRWFVGDIWHQLVACHTTVSGVDSRTKSKS